MKSKPPYVALPVAARQLGCSPERVIVLIAQQTLRAKLVGGSRWWVERQSLEALLRFRRRYPAGPGGRAA